MNVLFKYYSNHVRLVTVMKNLASEASSFRFYCLQGSLVNRKGAYAITSKTVTVLLSYVSKEKSIPYQVVLTSNPDYSSKDGNYVDLATISHANVYEDLLNHIKNRYNITGSEYNIQFSSPSGVLSVKSAHFQEDPNKCIKNAPGKNNNPSDSSGVVCTLHGLSGSICISGEKLISEALESCTGVESFCNVEYTGHSIIYSVSKSTESYVLSDIATYLNKVICVVLDKPNLGLVEYYFDKDQKNVEEAKMVLEVSSLNGKRTYKKVPKSSVTLENPICVYLTTATIASIIHEQGRSLKKS